MGFEMNLLIMRSHEWEPHMDDADLRGKKLCTLWEIEQILHMGHMSVPVKTEHYTQLDPRQRAAIHLTQRFFGKFCKEILRVQPVCFAPPFAVKQYKKGERREINSFFEWGEMIREGEIAPGTFIRTLSGSARSVPFQENAELHNQALMDGQLIPETGPIMRVPLVWFPCKALFEWIQEGEKKEPDWLTLRPDDKEGFAFYRTWRSAIEHMSEIDAQCLFYFETIHAGDIV